MAAMIENRGGDAGEGLALFAAIECVADLACLLEFGEKGGGAGDGVTRVFGELHLLHEGFLRIGTSIYELATFREITHFLVQGLPPRAFVAVFSSGLPLP